MEIRSIQGPQGLDALGATAAPAPQPQQEVQPEPSNSLAPAVKIDLSDGAFQGRFIRDTDTRALVYQVVDSSSGDVVDQFPTENVLRNRAYASSSANAAQTKAGTALRVA